MRIVTAPVGRPSRRRGYAPAATQCRGIGRLAFRRMQLFAVAYRFPAAGEDDVVRALERAAGAFDDLGGATMERGASETGRLAFAAIAHPSERAAPRTYLARVGR